MHRVPQAIAGCLLLAILFVFFTGCLSDKPSDKIIRYNMSTPVSNLDPQYATDPNEIMIILNCMEGLLSKTGDGSLVPAAALGYDVSADGLRYTFYLRQDAKWSPREDESGENIEPPVTAEDFVFAFRRMFDPSVPSPYAVNFLSIKNASKVLEGELASAFLGVRAADDYTLSITLERADPFFPELLATSAAMPCNEDFYLETKGRYGLSPKNLLYNGWFTVNTWDNSQYVRLRRNRSYHTQEAITPGGVNLYVGIEPAQNASLLDQDRVDAAPVSFSDVGQLQAKKFQCTEVENTVYVLLFNLKRGWLANDSLRLGLAQGVNRDLFLPHFPANLTMTTDFIPSAACFQNDSYRSLAGPAVVLVHDSDQAVRYFSEGMGHLGLEKFPKSSILSLDTGGHKFLSGFIQQQWQKDFNIYVNIEDAPEDEFYQRLASGEFDAAIVPFTLPDSNPINFLNQILPYLDHAAANPEPETEGSVSQPTSQLPSRDILLGNLDMAARSKDFTEAAGWIKTAENYLIENGLIVPLYTEASFYATDKGLTGIRFTPYPGYLYFNSALLQ